ncbi:hypothetical protein HDU96_000760 [Phlyctochytrium bullatum]|nr:hypothetical protein HDU96_000760 [Phlyctochytrium bullatum]
MGLVGPIQNANDGTVAIACLSLGVDSALLLHRVMRYLAVEDHLALFETCSALRRILTTETGPSVACSVFPQAVDRAVSIIKIAQPWEVRLYLRKPLFMLLRIMAFNTAVAAAVLMAAVAANEQVCSELLLYLCRVSQHGPHVDLARPPKVLWDCCNDELVLAAINRKRKRGIDDSYETEHPLLK